MPTTKQASTDRRHAGLTLAATRGAVQQVARDQWVVASQSSGGARYLVTLHTSPDGEELWECQCPEAIKR